MSNKPQVRNIELTLKEVMAPNGGVAGLVIVASPYACAANVGDTLNWIIKTDLEYATPNHGERLTEWKIQFFKPSFEHGDGNKPYGWPFKEEKPITTHMISDLTTFPSPVIVSKKPQLSKVVGKNMARRYTYTVSAKIPFGDNAESFPGRLLPDGEKEGWYTVTEDPEIYVDEC